MKKISLIVIVAALLATSFAYAMPNTAQGEVPQAMQERMQASFDRMDSDKDGKVTRQEFTKAHPNMTEEAFSKIDSKKDGFLDKDEWSAFMLGHASDMRSAPARQMQVVPSGAAMGQKPLITPPAK